MFVFGIVSIEVWPTQFLMWGIIPALFIVSVYIVPIGIIQAVTNQQIGIK